MNNENNIEVITPHTTEITPQQLETSITAFDAPLASYLNNIGLPIDNVLEPINERKKIVMALESALEPLSLEQREKAFYLSKFTVAVTVGLFDGALNFLWDEAVKALRKLIVEFDLEYFFSVAGEYAPKYKKLVVENDLEAVSDYDMLKLCQRIGLINDVTFKKLEYVNYFRNHASSAHPNDNSISGFEMLQFLESCLKYAITATPDISAVNIKRLFDNIRKHVIPESDFESIGVELAKQPQERIDDFLLTLFGLYCSTQLKDETKDNIEGISQFIWNSATEDTRLKIGAKFGLYRLNGDVTRKERTQKFLEIVDGEKYKDEDSLAAELIEKLENLKSSHFANNNFYNEYSHALSIARSIGTMGIPSASRKLFVKVISMCFAGNGKGFREGVDERAEVYYKDFIRLFKVPELYDFLNLFSDGEFTTDLDKTKPDKRMRAIAKFLKDVTNDVHINNALDIILTFPPKKLMKLPFDTNFKETMKFIKL